eukprot:TRINITY_DN33370_c0_g1_i1.p2 TRINITY_DN33370_c0_g1~~TRINITY_DN33370_c0_g1_i1.p2  ORF type:complete len:219 (+),score=36.68 TRINITY_DN33370_c0_g1_i1:73-729(+)
MRSLHVGLHRLVLLVVAAVDFGRLGLEAAQAGSADWRARTKPRALMRKLSEAAAPTSCDELGVPKGYLCEFPAAICWDSLGNESEAISCTECPDAYRCEPEGRECECFVAMPTKCLNTSTQAVNDTLCDDMYAYCDAGDNGTIECSQCPLQRGCVDAKGTCGCISANATGCYSGNNNTITMCAGGRPWCDNGDYVKKCHACDRGFECADTSRLCQCRV